MRSLVTAWRSCRSRICVSIKLEETRSLRPCPRWSRNLRRMAQSHPQAAVEQMVATSPVGETVPEPAPTPEEPSVPAAAPAPETYKLQSGDTLSGIAQQVYGDANAYMRIFEANRDKLSDPN